MGCLLFRGQNYSRGLNGDGNKGRVEGWARNEKQGSINVEILGISVISTTGSTSERLSGPRERQGRSGTPFGSESTCTYVPPRDDPFDWLGDDYDAVHRRGQFHAE